MGYYSEVVIVLEDRGYRMLLEKIKREHRNDVADLLRLAEITRIDHSEFKDVIISFDWIKWYGETVRYIEGFLHSLCGYDGEEYRLVGVGEDNAIVEEGNGDGCLADYVCVSVSVDIPNHTLPASFDDDFNAICAESDTKYPDINMNEFEKLLNQ